MKRRNFIKHTGQCLLFTVGGASLWLTPAAARVSKVPLKVLSPEQQQQIDALGDGLAKGAKAAGLSHFIDNQLARPLAESLLMIRYLGVPHPFTDFYRSGLANADAWALSRFKRPIIALNKTQLDQLIGDLARDKVTGWQGAPASFFYFVLRADAVDMAYGTVQGFQALNTPYLAHIKPETTWL